MGSYGDLLMQGYTLMQHFGKSSYYVFEQGIHFF